MIDAPAFAIAWWDGDLARDASDVAGEHIAGDRGSHAGGPASPIIAGKSPNRLPLFSVIEEAPRPRDDECTTLRMNMPAKKAASGKNSKNLPTSIAPADAESGLNASFIMSEAEEDPGPADSSAAQPGFHCAFSLKARIRPLMPMTNSTGRCRSSVARKTSRAVPRLAQG